ncbi:MAG: hypothetical protein ABIH67_00955 [Candidatus Uhrbacteria bacterium]
MDKNQIENTQALQERFHETYERFFAEHDLVISGGMNFNITTGLTWRAGAPAVKHKIPFRMYAGVKKNNENGTIKIEKTRYYSSRDQQIIPLEYEPINLEKSIPILHQEISKRLKTKDFPGITLDLLYEKPENTGFDAPSAFSIALVCFLYYGIIDLDTANKISKLTGIDLQTKEISAAKYFEDVISVALKLLSQTFHGVATGGDTYPGTLDGKSPFVYVMEERAGSVAEPYENKPPLDISDDLDRAESIKHWCFRLTEMAKINDEPIPLDVVSIYPGSSRQYAAAMTHVQEVLVPDFNKLQIDTKELFSKFDFSDQNRIPSFWKYIDRPGNYWQRYLRGQAMSRLYVLQELIHLYQYKMRSSNVYSFLEAQDALMTINRPFEEAPSRNLRYITRKIRERAHESGIKISFRSMFWGKEDASIMVFSQQGKFRDQIMEVIESIQKEYNPNIHIEFASWRDGWADKGLEVNQFISQGIYSDFIEQNSKQLTLCNEKGECSHTVVKDTEVQRNQFDLFLDKINGKISVRGQEFSSKEIPSQKATIEILEFLMQNLGKTVSNKDLPKSGYTEYRNELQGKIFSPLNKLLHEQLGREVDLKINGQLMNFEINFATNGLTVGILDRIK